MFRKLFGPFPDEPLLYTFDTILGLFHKFDPKLNCKDAENQIDLVVPVVEKIDDVLVKSTTENDVTTMDKISLKISETNSMTSKKSTVECIKILDTDKVNDIPDIPEKIRQQADHNSNSPRSIPKTSSSMECNYDPSIINVGKKTLHTKPNAYAKKANRHVQTRAFGDSVTVLENTFERKLFRLNGKQRFESILRKETKQQRVVTSPRPHTNRVERLYNRLVNERTDRKNSKLITDRKVIKTEWAVTRIFTFDDDSQTYEIMKKDKVLEKNGGIDRIFAIAPNQTIVAYETLKDKIKKR